MRRLAIITAVLAATVAASAHAALYGVDYTDGNGVGQVTRLDPATLRPTSHVSAVGGYLWAHAWAPGGRRVALSLTSRGRVALVDPGPGRGGTRLFRRGVGAPLSWLAWPRSGRIVAAGDDGTIAWFSRRTARLHVRVRGDHRIVAGAPTATGLALVTGPRRRIGPASLVHAEADGRVRTFPLAGMRAGQTEPDRNLEPGEPIQRYLRPGVAVDRRAGVAYVADAARDRLARVDLATGVMSTVGYGLLARAAKGADGAMRQVAVVAPGRVAVSGTDERLRGGADPFGLRLVDAATGAARRLDDRASAFVHAGRRLLVASVFDPPGPVHQRGTGLTAFDPAGRRVYHRFGRRMITGLQAAAGRVYATRHRAHTTIVLRLRDGARRGRLRRALLPQLLGR